MARRRRPKIDLTVAAAPAFFGAMAVEHLVLRRRAARQGLSAGDYERRDTVASLTMGVGSLAAPFVAAKLLRPVTPGRGRYAKVLVAGAAVAAGATTVADVVVRRRAAVAAPAAAPVPAPAAPAPAAPAAPAPAAPVLPAPEPGSVSAARAVARVGGVTAVVLGGVAVATGWSALTEPRRLWRRRLLPDLGRGPLAVALAVFGWDFIYYWNHRLMHETRYLWADHVVHHSSERYNLSTALRQTVADAFGTFLPYGALCLLGVAPELVVTARGVNLIYQFWIHTETIGTLGPPEAVLNTASHHRVHHGSNRQYLDRNHGSILIIWDRLFGTFEPEGEPVVYGLTTNINTFNPIRIAGHEYAAMLRDVAGSTGWGERLSYVLRGPGWPARHRAELAARRDAAGTLPQPRLDAA